MLVVDGLSTILNKADEHGVIQPLKVCRRAPGITHLLFADDSLLFFKADNNQAREIKEENDVRTILLYDTCTI